MRNVLFVCTANSARSVLGEGLPRHLGEVRYAAGSGGATLRGPLHPDALDCLTLPDPVFDAPDGQGADRGHRPPGRLDRRFSGE